MLDLPPQTASPAVLAAPRPDVRPGPTGIAPVRADAPIRAVSVQGGALPPQADLVLRDTVGRVGSEAEFRALLARLSTLLQRGDLAFFNLSLAGWTPQTGELALSFVPGFIEDVRISTTGRCPRRLIQAMVAPLLAERPLRRATYDRVLGLLSDVPGAQVSLAMETGSRKGGLVLTLKAECETRSMNVTVGNQVTDLIGDITMDTGISLPNLFLDGDLFSAAVGTSSRPSRYWSSAVQYAVPIGSNGARATFRYASIDTRIFYGLIQGRSKNYVMELRRPLWTRRGKDIAATVAFDRFDSDNNLLSYRLASDRIRSLRLGLRYRNRSPVQAIQIGATLSQGLDIMGARDTPDASTARYRKVSIEAAFDRRIAPRLVAHVQGSAQLTADRLPGIEGIALGGSSLRAVRNGDLFGDTGYAASAELRLSPALPKALDGSEVFAFIDHGATSYKARPPFTQPFEASMTAVGAGVRVQAFSALAADMGVARSVATNLSGAGKWRFFLTARLALSDPR